MHRYVFLIRYHQLFIFVLIIHRQAQSNIDLFIIGSCLQLGTVHYLLEGGEWVIFRLTQLEISGPQIG